MMPFDPTMFLHREIATLPAMLALFGPIAIERVEVAVFAYVDKSRRLLGMRQTRSLRADRIEVPLRAMVANALALEADALLMAHNHPSGDPSPSQHDIEVTRQVVRLIRPLGMQLIDHVVLARSATVSFVARGLL